MSIINGSIQKDAPNITKDTCLNNESFFT